MSYKIIVVSLIIMLTITLLGACGTPKSPTSKTPDVVTIPGNPLDAITTPKPPTTDIVIKQGKPGEFYYFLKPGYRSDFYPREIRPGDSVSLTLGIVNGEKEKTAFRVEITISGEKLGIIAPGVLEPGQKWEQVINFVIKKSGQEQKVEMTLFRGEETKPYYDEPLSFQINVREP